MTTATLNGNSYAGYARAFAIFAEYDPEGLYGVNPAHDEITAGPDPGIVSAEHIEELEALGWTQDSESETTFHKFT